MPRFPLFEVRKMFVLNELVKKIVFVTDTGPLNSSFTVLNIHL